MAHYVCTCKNFIPILNILINYLAKHYWNQQQKSADTVKAIVYSDI